MIVLFPLWRRRWWVESVLDSDDRLDAARSPRGYEPSKQAGDTVQTGSRSRRQRSETMPIQVEPGIPTEVPAASRRPGPSKTRSAAIYRCGKNGARLRRPQCGRMRKPSRNRPRRSAPPRAREETTTRWLTRTPWPAVSIGSCPAYSIAPSRRRRIETAARFCERKYVRRCRTVLTF